MTPKTILGRGALAVAVLLSGALAITALRNRSLPDASAAPAVLSDAAQAHLAETHHLLDELGNEVWPATASRPGWSDVPIPLIAYDESYAYLVGHPDPPPGWARLPDLRTFGTAWEPIGRLPGDASAATEADLLYRAALPGGGVTPEAFTVRVGDLWTASLATQEWARVMLYQQFRADLPPGLRAVFPYRLAAQLLLQGTDGYAVMLAHEAFHAYQASVAPARLIAGEQAQRAQEGRYPGAAQTTADEEALTDAWQVELDLLVEAMRASTPDETRELAHQFLTQRARRRADQALDPALVDYEQQREWVEGLAKYAELSLWGAAYAGVRADPPTYRPTAAIRDQRGFRSYAAYPRRYKNEVAQTLRTAGRHGDGRFYYTGMAQAYLLDRFAPGWKATIFDDGVFLEDLLAAAAGFEAP